MQMPYLLLQTVLIPIFFAPVIVLVGRRIGKRVGWVVFGVLTYTNLLLLVAATDLWGGGTPVLEEYMWSTSLFALKIGLMADGLSLPVALIMNIICAACAVYSIQYIDHRIVQLYGDKARGMYPVYFSLYLLFSIGLVGVALSTNLIEMYLFIELVLIPSYFMIDLFGYVDKHRIATMYFIWNHIGAALFLLGVILAYMGTGSFDVSACLVTLGPW
jgi:NADH-quinone oxidoreductase subunit M